MVLGSAGEGSEQGAGARGEAAAAALLGDGGRP